MAVKRMFLNINGVDRAIIADPEKDTLAAILRRMGLTGTKVRLWCRSMWRLLGDPGWESRAVLHAEDQECCRVQ